MPSRFPDSALLRGLWPWPVVLGLIVVAVYAGALRVPFLFDDAGAVVNNPSIRQLATALTPPLDGSTTTGRPVVNFSFALSYKLGGGAAWAHRAVNLAIHAAAAVALFGLVRRTLSGPVLGARYTSSAPSLAFAVSLLWAVHPLQTESVTCIAQRTESLCGLFYLLTLYAFVRGAAAASAGWLVLSCIACLLGMGTKEVMVSAPLLVLLHDRTFIAGSFRAADRARRGYYLGLASTWLLLLALLLAGGGTRGVSAGLGLGLDGWAYLLKQAEALVLYLKLSVWPHPLVLDYGTAVAHSPGEVWWQGLIVLTLLALTIWALVRRPIMGFAGAWFFLILAPSSSFVPLVTQTMAEHRMYLPVAALIGLGIAGFHRLLASRAWLAWGALAVVFAWLTVVRNNDYRDPLTIWTDTVAKCPRSARAQHNLGVELLRLGRGAEALPHFEQAVAIQPDYVAANYSWGLGLLEQGRGAEAIDRLERTVELGPAHADAHLALGNALMQAHRPTEAVPHFEESLRLKPAADAHYNLAVTLTALGRTGEAERNYRAALGLDPGLAPAHHRLGMILAQGGRLDEAEGHFRILVGLEPDNADAHANYGNLLLLSGRTTEAIAEYETALRLRPGDERALENLRLAREARR